MFTHSFWNKPWVTSDRVQLHRDILNRAEHVRNSDNFNQTVTIKNKRYVKESLLGGIWSEITGIPSKADVNNLSETETMEVKLGHRQIIITDPHLLNNPNHPIVQKVSRMLELPPKVFLGHQKALIADKGDEFS